MQPSAADCRYSIFPADICGGSAAQRRVPQFQTPRSLNFRESFCHGPGCARLRFGGELLNVETGIRDVSSLLGNFDFTGRFTGVNGNVGERRRRSAARLSHPVPAGFEYDLQHLPAHVFRFVQDDWKVTRKLTLNLGLRYEFATPPRERDFKWANFDPPAGKFVAGQRTVRCRTRH